MFRIKNIESQAFIKKMYVMYDPVCDTLMLFLFFSTIQALRIAHRLLFNFDCNLIKFIVYCIAWER